VPESARAVDGPASAPGSSVQSPRRAGPAWRTVRCGYAARLPSPGRAWSARVPFAFRFLVRASYSDSQLVHVLDAMFPNPIHPLGRLVAQVARVKVAAQEEDKTHIFAELSFELDHLFGFFLASLVHVGKVPGRFR